MALLQKILVPLLAVNDTTLSVIEVNFKSKEFVQKGNVLMVFETSKTTFEVVAEVDGFIKIFCEVGKDYDVNEVALEIYEKVEEIVIEDKHVQHTLPVKENLSESNLIRLCSKCHGLTNTNRLRWVLFFKMDHK